ncbi:MAG: lysophospholipid acyltransferase family protein [Bacteroidales bacterium]|jgi:1-acyl-sn-glycerol-3-phosphate acyltransferase|nr:lysophospholipid acyltransferase family protein [Bacteroidales bacterium]
MKKIIFSVYVWLLLITTALVLSLPFVIIWLFTVLFDKRLIVLHYYANFWGSLLTVLVPGWNIKLIGKEKLNSKAKIIVANHQSQEDVLLIYRLGVPFRWISKADVFKTPIYGWLMSLKGDIKVQRSNKASIKQMFIDAEKVLRKGSSITIFPEGTRSKTGYLGNFKEGAFKLAQAAEIPIVPVVIYGTGTKLIYPNGIFKGKHSVIVKILDEISYEEIKDKNTKELANKVKNLIELELNMLKLSENGN